jgi:hypothetical protein
VVGIKRKVMPQWAFIEAVTKVLAIERRSGFFHFHKIVVAACTIHRIGEFLPAYVVSGLDASQDAVTFIKYVSFHSLLMR